jgi:hypothetical protein
MPRCSSVVSADGRRPQQPRRELTVVLCNQLLVRQLRVAEHPQPSETWSCARTHTCGGLGASLPAGAWSASPIEAGSAADPPERRPRPIDCPMSWIRPSSRHPPAGHTGGCPHGLLRNRIDRTGRPTPRMLRPIRQSLGRLRDRGPRRKVLVAALPLPQSAKDPPRRIGQWAGQRERRRGLSPCLLDGRRNQSKSTICVYRGLLKSSGLVSANS